MLINVLFSDNTDKVVQGYLGSPQDPATWPNQGQIETSDARWAAYYDALPVTMQSGLPVPD